HEGWLLVKKYITKSFETSKDIAYITFLDLLDNLISAALDIYMHLFCKNHFEEYINTIFWLWTIMQRFQRHNYDKIMLAFFSDIQYWKITKHPIINILKTHLNVAKVTIGMSLRRDAIFLDHCHYENAFVTSFEAKRDYPYTEKDLNNLVKQSAIFLLRINEDINEWIDSDAQPETDTSEDVEPVKECVEIDKRLERRIT
ncbi:9711_t:CDS:2, partial [Cetraspora pellucida]